jgi:CTP-dependent riboflavin kinase
MAGKRDKKSNVQASSVKNWLDELAAEVNVPFAPEGWHTIATIAERLDVDHQTVRRILSKRKAESKIFRCVAKNGKVFRTPHYKL